MVCSQLGTHVGYWHSGKQWNNRVINICIIEYLIVLSFLLSFFAINHILSFVSVFIIIVLGQAWFLCLRASNDF